MQNTWCYVVSICQTDDDNLYPEVSQYIKCSIVRSFANDINAIDTYE